MLNVAQKTQKSDQALLLGEKKEKNIWLGPTINQTSANSLNHWTTKLFIMSITQIWHYEEQKEQKNE